MICNVCFSMLRGQAGRQWRGSFDLSFDHQDTLGSLKQSVDMACCICRRIWEDMPVVYDRLKFSPLEKRAFVSAHISVIQKQQGLYRLDFTLNGSLAAKYGIGTLLLRQTANQSETRVYTPQSRRLNSQEVLNLARSWIKNCIGPDHKHCPDIGFHNRFDLQSTQPVRKASVVKSEPNGAIKPLVRAKTYIEVNPPFYPTRLIELGSVDKDTVKLVVTKKPVDPDAEWLEVPQGQYVTLSHCWGNIGNPFCLNTSNLEVFRDMGIPLRELPQTFKDAIHFARRLSSNVKYIWIDSLCIIQGDPEDWLHESTQMFQVYRNSYCNISATASKDSSQGLYAKRDPQLLWGEDVNLNTQDMLRVRAGSKRKADTSALEIVSTPKRRRGSADPDTGTKRNLSWKTETPDLEAKKDAQDLGTLIQRCSIIDPSLWDRKVDAAPVNRRAWVLQERLLAPRVLHFCEDQIAWECRELDASESAAAGIENFELKSGIIRDRVRLKSLVALEYGVEGSMDEADALKAQENWKRITERYSLTSLTKGKDKLIALAGIAEQMSTQIAAPYVAGMWKNKYFASQLLWRVETLYKNGKFLYPSKRPAKEYRAPSFSWAAIDAPQGIRCGETQDEGNLLIAVIEVNVQPQPQPNSRFGLVKEGGFVRLEGQTIPIAIEKKFRRTANGQQDDVYIWTLAGEREGDDAKMHPNVYLDSPEDDFENTRGWESAILVPAYKNFSGDLIGLLLRQDSKNRHHFRRLGLSVIPGYVGADNGLTDGGSVDDHGQFRKVKKRVIQIF